MEGNNMGNNMTALFILWMRRFNDSRIPPLDLDSLDASREQLSRASDSSSSPIMSRGLVTTEEVIIVTIVLLMWLFLVLLFLRNWSKIRGLDPVTPFSATFEGTTRQTSFSLSAAQAGCRSSSRDTLLSGIQRPATQTTADAKRKSFAQSDTQSERLDMRYMPMHHHVGSSCSRNAVGGNKSASSPDVRFAHFKRPCPLSPVEEKESQDLSLVPETSESSDVLGV